jgi:hypothetical protein
MFPTAHTPLSSRLRRGIDLAVQFATLGEYGVLEGAAVGTLPPPAPGTAARVAPPPPGGYRRERAARTAGAVRPATAAARRRNEPPRRVSTRAAVRSLALRPAPGAAPRPRQRVGQAPPRPQPCVAP